MHEVMNTIIGAILLFVIKEMSECRLLFNSNEFPSRVNACKERWKGETRDETRPH